MIRIADSTLYSTGMDALQGLRQRQAELLDQRSSGLRVKQPSDDPSAVARAVIIADAASAQAQYKANRDMATFALSGAGTTLTSIGDLLTRIRERVIAAGSPTLSDQDRAFYATEIQGYHDSLIAFANTKDANGHHLFSGYQSHTPPFIEQGGRIQFAGDGGQRIARVDDGRDMTTNLDGERIFMATSGRGGTLVIAGRGNAGTAGATLENPGAQATGPVTVRFSITAGVITYTIDDGSGPPTSGVYRNGASIHVGGMQLTFSGTPDDQDSFTIQPAAMHTAQSSPDVFSTVAALIDALKQPAANSRSGQTALENALAVANRKLRNTADQVEAAQTSISTRVQELEALEKSGRQTRTDLAGRLSGLEDLEFIGAVQEGKKIEFALQAALHSIAATKRLSLLDLIRP